MAVRFSIVIPNYHSGRVLERAITSLLQQNYPNLQLIICDSESRDESREIIERYRDAFDVVIIEKDRGQADGLNKGFARANGDIFGWLCADDELAPGALAHVADLFSMNRDADVVTGACMRVFADSSSALSPPDPAAWSKIDLQCCLEQSATFWRSSLHHKLGPLDTSFHLTFDWDLWNRMKRAGAKLITTQQILSRYHFSASNKTGSAGNQFVHEAFRVVRRYGPMHGLAAHIYRFLYQHFDLHGCYDKPPTCTLIRSHIFVSTLALLRALVGRRLLYMYNWHFASCQQRNLKWW